MTDKYAGLAGNQNAAKSEDQRKRGFTLHKYVPYIYVDRIYEILGDDATPEHVREYALQICEEALKLRLDRKWQREQVHKPEGDE